LKACIFDLDGVLVDTARYHYQAWNRLADKLGFEISEEENEKLKGISRMESLDQILKLGGVTYSDDEKIKLAALKNSWYVELISDMDESELLEGVTTLLKELKKNDIKICLGSASKNAKSILKSTKIIKYFDALVDGTDTTQSKPDPQVFLIGAERLNLNPKDIIVFEDAVSGVQAANTGGFYSIGVGDEAVLTEARKVIKGVSEITVQEIIEL
jgi:beta-phosphoglucomutase